MSVSIPPSLLLQADRVPEINIGSSGWARTSDALINSEATRPNASSGLRALVGLIVAYAGLSILRNQS